MPEPFTIRDHTLVQPILEAAQEGRNVKRMLRDENGDEDRIVEGIARSVGTEQFTFASRDADVRDLFLRVTSRSGTEFAWPVRDLMADFEGGYFATYPRS